MVTMVVMVVMVMVVLTMTMMMEMVTMAVMVATIMMVCMHGKQYVWKQQLLDLSMEISVLTVLCFFFDKLFYICVCTN